MLCETQVATPYPTALLIREKALVVNIEAVRMIICKDQCFVSESGELVVHSSSYLFLRLQVLPNTRPLHRLSAALPCPALPADATVKCCSTADAPLSQYMRGCAQVLSVPNPNVPGTVGMFPVEASHSCLVNSEFLFSGAHALKYRKHVPAAAAALL